MTNEEIFEKLSEKFPAESIEWRISQSGKKANGDIWARCLAYITNRAIQDRLDAVFTPFGWRNEFREWKGGQLCGISVKYDGEWITKWDGAQDTQFESMKGGISGSMKRAAVQWGIGRYLYNLDEAFAIVSDKGKHYQSASRDRDGKEKCPAFKWDEPSLPAWALPHVKPAEKAKGVFGSAVEAIEKTDTAEKLKNIELALDTREWTQQEQIELAKTIKNKRVAMGW